MQPVITVSVNPSATVVTLKSDEQVLGSLIIVELDNSDGSLNAVNYEGLPCTVSLSPGGGIPDGWVYRQEQDSYEGKSILRLLIVDAWFFLDQSIPSLEIQLWNSPLMIDPDTSNPYPRFADYYDKNIAYIINHIISQSIGGSLSGGAGMPDIKPQYQVTNAARAARDMVSFAPGHLVVSGSTFTYTQTPSSPTYTYQASAGETLVTIYTIGVAIPNKIMVQAIDPKALLYRKETPVLAYGEAIDPNKLPDTPLIVRAIQLYQELTSTECETYAEALLAKVQNEVAQGQIITHQTRSQALMDKVTGTDARGYSVTGTVMRIRRTYDRGIYQMVLDLGGAAGSAGYPSGAPAPGAAGGVTPYQSEWPDWSKILPKAVQGYHHDITFSEVDWDTVQWTSGTIKFYDESTQEILSGNTGNLATADIYYIYFDLDDASPNVLKVIKASDYLGVLTEYTSVLCVVQRASYSEGKPIFLPGWDKQPLIVTDMIYMAGLKDWTDPDTGGRFHAILDTQIQAGAIWLSEHTSFAPGYNPSLKKRVFVAEPTTPYDIGDLWVTGNEVRRCQTARASGSFVASDWVKTSQRAFTGSSNPTPPYSVGDLWIHSGITKRCITAKAAGQSYSAGDWVDISLDDIADGTTFGRVKKVGLTTGGLVILGETFTDLNARFVSDGEKATWNGKEVAVHRGTSAPSDTTKLWLDTSTTPHIWKRWSGSAWVKCTPSTADEIAETAARKWAAVSGADITDPTKVVFYGSTAPTHSEGRLWYDTVAKKLKRSVSSAWVVVGDETTEHANDIIFYCTTTPSSPKEGMLWFDCNVHQMKRYTSGSWVVVERPGTQTFYTTPTTPYYVGDIWIDDKIYKYCSTSRLSGSFNSADWSNTTKKRIGATYIDDGQLYLSSVIEDGYHRTVTDSEKTEWVAKTKTFRQTTAPTSGMKTGDIWIDTANGDKPYTYSGSAWIASYTKIDGGHITTGTIDCSSVTIQTAGSGTRVRLNSSGIQIFGQCMDFYYGTSLKGYVFAGSDGLIVSGLNNVTFQGTDIKFNTTGKITMPNVIYLQLPSWGAPPSGTPAGALYYDTSKNLLVYYKTGVGWRILQDNPY